MHMYMYEADANDAYQARLDGRVRVRVTIYQARVDGRVRVRVTIYQARVDGGLGLGLG